MKDTVIITGSFTMPDGDAAASRVKGLAYALASAGYKVVFQGKNTETESSGCNYYKINEFTWKTRPPYNRKAFYFDCEYIKDTINEIGCEKVKAVILYHHPSISTLKLLRYCKTKKIKLITDTTEWYSIYQLRTNRHAVFVIADFYLRMLYVNKKVGNLIVISSYLKEFYKGNRTKVLQIPILNINKDYLLPDRTWECLRVCYCGSPAKKDLLEPIVHAVKESNKNGKRVELHIVGVSKEDYCRLHSDNDVFSDYIFFYGRVEHSAALDVLRKCDFSMIIRNNERYAKAGFPTKMVEAFSNGIGVIATPCGDIPNYIYNGENGFLVNFPEVEKELISLFDRISRLSNYEIFTIKQNAIKTARAFFSPEAYAEKLDIFLNA